MRRLSSGWKQRAVWRAFDLIPAPGVGGGKTPAHAPVPEGPDPARVGVFLQWGIGDAVLATPLLASLRERFPSASLELIGKPWLGDLFAGTPWCDRTHVLVPPWTKYARKYRVWEPDWRRFQRELRRLRRERFDWLVGIRHDPREVIQLRWLDAAFKAGYGGGGRRGLHLDMGVPPHLEDGSHVSRDAARAAEVLTGLSAQTRPAFPVAREESAAALSRLEALGYRGGRVVAVSWGAGHPIRRWDPKRFAEVLGGFPEDVGFVLMIAEPGQPLAFEPPGRIPSTLWHSSLAELKAMLSVVDLLLCVDSGVMHMASACGCRVVSVFGPTRPQWYGPHDPLDHVVIVDPMPCRPCFDACIYREPICMLGVTAAQVASALAEAFGGLGRPRAEVLRNTAG